MENQENSYPKKMKFFSSNFVLKYRSMTPMTILDEAIRQASPGDPRLYELLMVDFYNFIYRLTSSILGDPCEADDAAQETMIQAATHISNYQVGTNIKSWLARIAINICRDRQRRMHAAKLLQGVLKIFSRQALEDSPTPEEVVLHNERQRAIQAAIQSLDEKHRLPILLRYVQGMAIAEVAQALDVNEGTVHSRLHYAHLKIRDRLEELARDQNSKNEEGRV